MTKGAGHIVAAVFTTMYLVTTTLSMVPSIDPKTGESIISPMGLPSLVFWIIAMVSAGLASKYDPIPGSDENISAITLTALAFPVAMLVWVQWGRKAASLALWVIGISAIAMSAILAAEATNDAT